MKHDPVSNFWTVETFGQEYTSDSVTSLYKEVLPYVQQFLCADHPFREGKVCPFVHAALKKRRIFFTAIAEDATMQDCTRLITECVEFYISSRKDNDDFGAIIILFPKQFDIEKLLELQFNNKEYCVQHALMLGALYPTSQAPSLHNENWYPLRTPTPVLVIRDIVPNDLVFLDSHRYNLRKRLVFLETFIDIFHNKKGKFTQKMVREGNELCMIYRKKQCLFNFIKLVTFILIFLFIAFFLL